MSSRVGCAWLSPGRRNAVLAGALAALLVWAALPPEKVAAQDAPPAPAASAPAFSALQIDQLLAPIALYPDGLLGQILMASAYPLEIVEADRWRRDPARAGLSGDALVQALQSQPWDASVKSLTAFPTVLAALDDNLEWTEQLGEAFLAQQAQVMERVQELRKMAQASGALASSPQQTVQESGGAIQIAPALPDTVYVPEYDPGVVYGPWPYPGYPPDDFELAGYIPGGFIGFTIVAPLWGWYVCNWGRGGGITIVGRPGAPPPWRGPQTRPRPWNFDAQHRRGVPFAAQALRARLGGALPAASEYRGYAPPAYGAAAQGSGAMPAPGRAPAVMPGVERAPLVAPAPAVSRFEAEPAMRAAPPALESFGRGPQVQMQEQRGASSRASVSHAEPGGREHR